MHLVSCNSSRLLFRVRRTRECFAWLAVDETVPGESNFRGIEGDGSR